VARLQDVATVIRSKNAGPYELTLDIIFDRPDVFHWVREHEVFTPQTVAAAYGVAVADVRSIVYFDPVNALKITLRRPVVSGAVGDTDVYGAQQHAPLLAWDIGP